jgi:hypothetical protein
MNIRKLPLQFELSLGRQSTRPSPSRSACSALSQMNSPKVRRVRGRPIQLAIGARDCHLFRNLEQPIGAPVDVQVVLSVIAHDGLNKMSSHRAPGSD